MAYLPPCVLIMGFPVRVIAMSEMFRRGADNPVARLCFGRVAALAAAPQVFCMIAAEIKY